MKKKFDVIVIGGGTGLDIAAFCDERGLKTALIEKGPLGGTCHNRGCIPSKMLIHAADVVETIKSSSKFQIKANFESINFAKFVKSVSNQLDTEAKEMEKGIIQSKNIQFYNSKGKFIDKKTLLVANEEITAEKIIIVAGDRPSAPIIKGIENVPYVTSKEALRLTKQPKHLVIIGGGYIGAELGHFFGTLGTKITYLIRKDRMLKAEDSEISQWFQGEFAKKYDIKFETEAQEIKKQGDQIVIKLKNNKGEIQCDQLLVGTGRKPNTDILEVEKAGIKIDEKGYIKVNKYLETNQKDVWALGDIVGILPFKHTANHQAGYVIRNAFFNKQDPVDYHAIPHAIFSSPQVAGVGKTEDELKKDKIQYKVGKYEYKDTAMGDAIKENGLVKVLTDEHKNILGCHIVGPQASTLIQEVVIAMKTTNNASAIEDSVYVHPALPEVIQRAFFSIS